jgi:class 3 adenylate cyclase/DNA-binding winged helix-turn-helix (wHTH) protein
MSAPAETVRRTAIGQDGESPASTILTTERKLVAILSADVKGYSRLMGEDELATVRILAAYRDELMTTLVRQHGGDVVGAPGDNLLALFTSVVAAVQCAVEIQHALRVKNVELPASRRMEFRIGINLGDVLIQGAQIHGDGINIAARLEGLAEGGGICISAAVYEQIKHKVALRVEDLGEHTLKNIVEPVRVYRVRMEPEAEGELSRGLQEQLLFFSPFHLDVVNACLWRGKRRVSLTPKDFAVLHYLAVHPQQLVTHEELLKAVWSDVKVSPGVLKVCLRRIRQALGDSPTKPHFIETKHRQGYRFIAPLSTSPQPVSSSKFQVPGLESEPVPSPQFRGP